MKLKGLICLLICASMFVAGCGQQEAVASTEDTKGASVPTTEPTVEATTPTEPVPAPVEDRLPLVEGETVRMYYDDRLAISEFADENAAVTLVSQSGGAVDASMFTTDVLAYDEAAKKLIAVGVGEAQITVGDKTYTVKVEAAPISLVMIIGHSIGAGSYGNAAQSVVCQEGMAYSTHYASFMPDMATGVGLGQGAQIRPAGIDAFAPNGGGTVGQGSAIASRWNELTGEKIWLINAARGGTCLNEWVRYTDNYAKAYNLFRYAQIVLSNEIAAGHYRLKDMALIYHSAANYGYKGVTYTDKDCEIWFKSMWEGFKEDLSMDVNGDGAEETVSSMGFVPIWGESNRKIYEHDKPANFFMGASDAYPGMFMASLAIVDYVSPGGLENFPAIAYETQSEPVEVPKSIAAMYAADGVHHQQVVYNATGFDVAENLFAHLRTYVKAGDFRFMQPDGNKVYDSISIKKTGGTFALVPVMENIAASDLTFTLSENLELQYPCTLKALAPGMGSVTVSQNGQVLLTVEVEVKE